MADDDKTKKSTEARKWKKELDLAGKRERDWRDEADKIVKRYRGEEKKRNRFNVLWATTETLRPSIYNSRPNPDVRRRFRDADPVGKAVGEVLERSLFVLFDANEPDDALKNDLLDSLLGGRGVSRIKYVPKLAPDGSTMPEPAPEGVGPTDEEEGAGGSEPHEDDEGSYEQVEDEQVEIEHVDYRDYREGYARTWAEVPWQAFRHKLTRDDAEAKFPKDIIDKVKFAQPNTDDPKKPTDQVGETAKTAEFWEVWDKLGERVFFLQEEVQQLLFPKNNEEGEPPLDFEGFFPTPDPLCMVENTGSRLPIPPFRLYENQANELDQLSVRIDRIVKVCRLRGIYDSKIAEIPDLLAGDDNELTPVQNAQAWSDKGLDAAIAWMPVEKVQAVLAALYDARERQKAIIDELTGVSDIVRGATDPDETKGAQVLKSNYHSIRLSRMQKEVQRYARDLMRLSAQVMSSKFKADTFAKMTDLKFPTQQQKALMQQKVQAAQMQQQPPDPIVMQALQVPSWEDILALMHSPALRQFRVDVETDSTVSASLDTDMRGLSEVLKAITETMTGLAPLVQAGALPVDAAKEIVLSVIRRARMGMAVEDAFDKLEAPKPPQDPKAAQAAAKTQADAQQAQMEAQIKQQIEAMRQQGETQRQQMEDAARSEREQMLERMKSDREMMMERMRVDAEQQQGKFDAFVKIIVATIAATKQPDESVQPKADATVGGIRL